MVKAKKPKPSAKTESALDHHSHRTDTNGKELLTEGSHFVDVLIRFVLLVGFVRAVGRFRVSSTPASLAPSQLTNRFGGTPPPIGDMSLRTTSRTSPCASPSSAIRIA
jgi:hypothetical protein